MTCGERGGTLEFVFAHVDLCSRRNHAAGKVIDHDVPERCSCLKGGP